MDLIEKKYKDIETNVEKRWENGIDHHPKSIELFRDLQVNNSKF
jgi:hypothetical protein